MDMEDLVSEATAVHPSLHTQQQLDKSVHPMDMEGLVSEATAVHPTVHT